MIWKAYLNFNDWRIKDVLKTVGPEFSGVGLYANEHDAVAAQLLAQAYELA